MRTHTVQHLEFDLALLWRVEGEGVTQAALAQEIGMSEGHLSRRLARARRYRQELEQAERQATRRRDDDDDLPRLALTQDPARERRDWYDLDTDQCSIDRGDVLVPGRNGFHADATPGCSQRCPDPAIEGQRLLVRNVNGGQRVSTEGRRDHKPDPDGLSGGLAGPKSQKSKGKKHKPAARVAG